MVKTGNDESGKNLQKEKSYDIGKNRHHHFPNETGLEFLVTHQCIYEVRSMIILPGYRVPNFVVNLRAQKLNKV